jgi:hypothetical protein
MAAAGTLLPFASGGAVRQALNAGGELAQDIKAGWKVGDDITNTTKAGNTPSWGAVRQRYWKNEAAAGRKETHENIQRMERGLAPQQINPNTGKLESKELHHNPPQREGGLFKFSEVWPDEHRVIDKNRR